VAAAQRQTLNAATTDVQAVLMADEEVEDDERELLKGIQRMHHGSPPPLASVFYPSHKNWPILSSIIFQRHIFRISVSNDQRIQVMI